VSNDDERSEPMINDDKAQRTQARTQRVLKSIFAVIICVTGWLLLFDAGWRVGLGLLLLILSAGVVISDKR
jgi:hypothetical protein